MRAKSRGDSGAGRWLKDEGRVGRDRPPGAAVQLDQAGDKAAAAVGRTCGKATQRGTSRCPASDQHQEPDSRTGRTEEISAPTKTGPSLDQGQKLSDDGLQNVWGHRQHVDCYSRAACGETEAWRDGGCTVT